MAVIYLKHPVHGRKVEANEAVAAQDRENGWVDYDPYEVVAKPVEETPPAAEAPVPDFLKPSRPKRKSEG